MVDYVILIIDAEGVLRDQEVHVRNRACQRIDAHENVILGDVVVV